MNKSKEFLAVFELTIMIISIFAFSYMIYQTDKLNQINFQEKSKIKRLGVFDVIKLGFNYLRKPLIPLASAYTKEELNQIKEYGGILNEETTNNNQVISSSLEGSGCCGKTNEGLFCSTTTSNNCAENFAPSVLCSHTSFCQKGCCYNEALGIYDQNVLKVSCPSSWIDDPNCNIPSAKKGCCVLGTSTIFETEKQCEIDTLTRALSPEPITDWRGDLNEISCILLSQEQKEGACILPGNDCKFTTQGECLSQEGNFNEGYLCTSKQLNTSCVPSEETTCVEGRDGVYFLDSCGNIANIYDSTKYSSDEYWEKFIPLEDSCQSNSENGNAKSTTCGNCNRIIGGICSSAINDSFSPVIGDFYCKDTSCTFEGKTYKNGESWCVYDGAIGNGDDVVGSRHWKYSCNYGVIQVEPCADYRNQICIQSNSFEFENKEVKFSSASCVANNWRECINLNSEEGGLEKCKDALNCRVEEIRIADKFSFDYCLPKYPGGFSLSDPRYQETAEQLCGLASQTCTVIYVADWKGRCKCKANCACEDAIFAQEMNDWCRGLGDCGLEVNIEGKYTENYKVIKSPGLSSSWIKNLVALATPVKGQYAQVENYTKYLEAAGIFGQIPESPNPEEEDGTVLGIDPNMLGMGIAGIGYAAGVIALMSTGATVGSSLALSSLGPLSEASSAVMGSSPGLAAFAELAIVIGIGIIVGQYLGKALGLSPVGSLMLGIGIGLAAGNLIGIKLLAHPATFWIGVVLIIISLFFGAKSCDPVEVKFECKPWQPPTGGSDCEKCNDNPLKPCSEYRCNSLGASCELINKGTENEMCIEENPNDVNPPRIEPNLEIISSNEIYEDVTSKGFSVTSKSGGCIDAYTPVMFGIKTDEPSRCKYDFSEKSFEEMELSFGGSYYKYNHTTLINLPDPSHGESKGAEWSGDLSLYIKCEDTHGIISPSYYTIDLCVNQGPDKTPPMFRATSPPNNKLIGFDEEEKEIEIITNELSTCKWDIEDKDYSKMENDMNCSDTLTSPSRPQGYLCTTNVPITNSSNTFYIRCMDQPWLEELERTSERNPNQESLTFNLNKPSKKIGIDLVEPNENFETPTDYTSIDLEVSTSNGGEYHTCAYSFSGYENMIDFFETGQDRKHIQPLNLAAKRHKIYVKCTDETGDFDQKETEFRITKDSSNPQVARVWQEGSTIYLITNEISECKYSEKNCRFNWEEAESMGSSKEHTFTSKKGQTYYIKCKDEFGNTPSDCSIQIKGI